MAGILRVCREENRMKNSAWKVDIFQQLVNAACHGHHDVAFVRRICHIIRFVSIISYCEKRVISFISSRKKIWLSEILRSSSCESLRDMIAAWKFGTELRYAITECFLSLLFAVNRRFRRLFQITSRNSNACLRTFFRKATTSL